MIKLKPIKKPAKLTTQKEINLTTEFKLNGTAVWNTTLYIKKAVRIQSNYKCVYCELSENDNRGNKKKGISLGTDHYFCKSLYPNEVVNLNNLLSCCTSCNSRKNNLDALEEPIIHPVIHNPKEHLMIKHHKFVGKTELGRKTVAIFKLGSYDKHCQYLMSLLFNDKDGYCVEITGLHNKCLDYNKNKTTERKNELLDGLKNIMQQAIPTAQYSAYFATHLLQNEDYQAIKMILQDNNLWTEFITLENEVQYCALLP